MVALDLNPLLAAIASIHHTTAAPIILSYSWDYPDLAILAILANVPPPIPKFYWHQADLTLGAIGSTAQLELCSQNRFAAAQEFCDRHLNSAISCGETAIGAVATFALGGFAFHDHDPQDWQGFPRAGLFIPTWLLQQQQGHSVLSLSVWIDPQVNLKTLQAQISEQVRAFPPAPVSSPRCRGQVYPQEITGDRPWTEMVKQAVQLIKRGKLEKVVLARSLDIKLAAAPPWF